MDLQAKIADLIYTHVSSMCEVNGIEDAADAVLEALPDMIAPFEEALVTAREDALREAARIADAATYHHQHCDQYCVDGCPTHVDVEAAILALISSDADNTHHSAILEAQAQIAKLELALGRIAKARTYDDIHNQTEVWELEEIAREALKETT
jgi:hypothetical protein